MAKKIDMKTKTDQELMKMVAETRAELRGYRFEAAGARPKDSNAPRNARKVIARVRTEQQARSKKTAA